MKTMSHSYLQLQYLFKKYNIQEIHALVSSLFLSQNTQKIDLKRGNVYSGSALEAWLAAPSRLDNVTEGAESTEAVHSRGTDSDSIVQITACILSEVWPLKGPTTTQSWAQALTADPASLTSQHSLSGGRQFLPNSLGNLGPQLHNYISISPFQWPSKRQGHFPPLNW